MRARKTLPPALFTYARLYWNFRFDAAREGLVGLVSIYDDAKQAWATAFGVLDPATQAFAPIGPANGTFGFLHQINAINALASEIGAFFFTAFRTPDDLVVVGVDTASGALVSATDVPPGFIDMSFEASPAAPSP